MAGSAVFRNRWQLRGGPGRVGRGCPPWRASEVVARPRRPGRRPENDPGRPDPARRNRLRRAESRPGHPRHPAERARPGRGRPSSPRRSPDPSSPASRWPPSTAVPARASSAPPRSSARPSGLRPRRIDDLRNLDQGLWQGLQLDEIKRRNVKVFRQWIDDPVTVCPPQGETDRRRPGADQGGAAALDPPPSRRGHRPGRRRADRPVDRLLPAARAPRPARRPRPHRRLRTDRSRP